MDYETFRTLVQASAAYQMTKGLYQDLYASQRKRQYHRLAKKQGLRAFTNNEVQIRLQARLSGRPHPKWPKNMGDLHIFLLYQVTNWEVVLPRALSIFGRVTAFNWRDYGFDDRKPGWLQVRDQMNEEMLRVFRETNDAQPVDAVCGYFSAYHISRETLLKLREEGPAIFNFCWDDTLNFPGKMRGGRYDSPAAIADAIDLNLTNVPASLVKYLIHGGLALFSPEAAFTEVHRPYQTKFDFDVTFIGGKYGWRPKFTALLARQGINLQCFGPGWQNGPLSDEDMVKMYSRSKVNLGFSAVGYSRRLKCLKGRDFEVPMSGGLYLTQDNPNLRLVYDVGREILVYRNAKDCAMKIRWILEHPKEANEIRQAGRARCLRDHTYKSRWGDVFMLAGILRDSNSDV